MSDLIIPANAIKFSGKDTIEGPVFLYSGPFTGKDLQGERFTPETDLCLDWFGKSGRPLLYEHGLDDTLKTDVIGRQTDYEVRDEGVWAQHELERGARYRKGVDALIERGALAYSGGAMPHLATKNARTGDVTRFPWVETSTTPTPANPANWGVHYVKSADAIAHLEAVDVAVPAPLKAALSALDEWADSRDAPLVPEKLADRLDRVSVELDGLHTHAREYAEMRVKSGRVLSAATRERLMRHPVSLRDLADELDQMLSEADAGKSIDWAALTFDHERAIARLLGVVLPEGVSA
ncbi:MAG: hypothetical protein ABIU97_00625 [Dehalococcoidia bacterium]